MRIKALFATRSGYTATCLALAIATMLVFAVRRGQDASWDQLNYHLSIPFLLLHGTFWDSIAPSGIQTYLNPLILVPEYLVIRALPPLAAVITIVVVQAMAFVIAARICLRIAGPDPGNGGYLGAFLGFVLCLASPMALSEAGTTIVDLIGSIPVLLGYLLLLTRDDASAPRHACLVAGLLLGLAAGLKLTNLVFVLGAPAFFLTGPAQPGQRAAGVAQLVLGAAIGFLSVAGWWHLTLWRRFHNPIFPYANNIFHSPDYPPVAQRDARFLPTSAWDILRYPYHWLVGGSPTPVLLSPASETDPKDARFALALAGAPVALAITLFRRPKGRALLARPETGLLLVCAIDYLVWLFSFGILRYLVPVEILCGAVLLVLTGWVAAGRWCTRLLLVLGTADGGARACGELAAGAVAKSLGHDRRGTLGLARQTADLSYLRSERVRGVESARRCAVREPWLRRNQSVRAGRYVAHPAAPDRVAGRTTLYALRGDPQRVLAPTGTRPQRPICPVSRPTDCVLGHSVSHSRSRRKCT